MRKVIAAILLLCGLQARAQFAAYWVFQDFVQNPYTVRQVNITELWNIQGNVTNIIAGQRQSKQTDLNGMLTISNMVPGAYRIDFIGPVFTNSFTNVFGPGTTGLTNALFAIGVSTNSVSGDGYAYTRHQVDVLLAGFQGGSATNAYQSQVAGVGLTIATNLSTFVYTFALNAALQLWSAFTPTAFSNGLYSVYSVADNLGSGTVPDARLAANLARTNNVNGPLRTNAFGIVDCYTNGGAPAWPVPDGSTGHQGNGQLWLRTNSTWTAINITGTGSGGSGTVTSVGLTVPPVLSVSGSPITGSGTLAVTATVNFETNNAAIPSGSMLKSTGGNGAGAATAGTDFVAPSTTITIAGTANQITSSAGAQDLSANRTATLSLPSTLVAPGTFAVTALETSHGIAIDQWLIQTNNTDHSLTFSNVLFQTTPLTILTNGTVLFGGVPLILGTSLGASQFVATDANTNLVSTQNGGGWTNLLHRTNFFATTNIFLPSDGLQWAGVITNGPHVWITPAGNGVGNWSLWIKSNVTIHLPLNIAFVGYSNVVVTNCLLDLQSFFDTNNIVAGESEL